MNISKWLTMTAFAGAMIAGSACSEKAADKATNATDVALDKAKAGATAAIDATKQGAAAAIDATQRAGANASDTAQKAADKTGQFAGDVAQKSKAAAASTTAVVSDAWITTKVSAKIADEASLKESDIHVETTDHVVTLKGSVKSADGKARAAEIARGTNGVTRVVNRLVVSERDAIDPMSAGRLPRI